MKLNLKEISINTVEIIMFYILAKYVVAFLNEGSYFFISFGSFLFGLWVGKKIGISVQSIKNCFKIFGAFAFFSAFAYYKVQTDPHIENFSSPIHCIALSFVLCWISFLYHSLLKKLISIKKGKKCKKK